jgi:hypothetical protein
LIPANLPPDLADYLQGLDDRLWSLEAPQQPGRLYACTKADLPSAAGFVNCVARATDLDILVVSNGSNWIRQDTGAIA